MAKKRSRIGQGMFEWVKTSHGRMDPRTGRVVGVEYAEPPRQYPAARYGLPYGESREMIVAPPPAAAREPGMFEWVGTSRGRIDPKTGRPGGAMPQPRPSRVPDPDEYSRLDLESIPSIDGWRRRGSSMGAGSSSSGWLVGLSVAVGFGIAAALALTMSGPQTKA